jgi:hypothetical protein
MTNSNAIISLIAHTLLNTSDSPIDPDYDMIDAIHAIREFRPYDHISPELRELIESLSMLEFRDLLISIDLCPLHAIDYQICDDDNDPECAHLRHADHDCDEMHCRP